MLSGASQLLLIHHFVVDKPDIKCQICLRQHLIDTNLRRKRGNSDILGGQAAQSSPICCYFESSRASKPTTRRMINLYSLVKNQASFRKMEVNELLFVEYTCLVEETRFGVWSNNNYVAYVTSGKKAWRTTSREYEAVKGDILFIKKGANLTHQFFGDEFCAIFLFLPDDFIRSIVQKNPTLFQTSRKDVGVQDAVIRLQTNELLESYFDSVASYLSLNTQPNERVIMLKLEELILQACTTNGIINDYFLSLGQSQAHQLSRIMEDNFSFNLKLDDYATLCNMSLSSFKRAFRQQYKTTPAAWLRQRKLELAHTCVTTTDMPVNQIALQCGFEDASHFIRTFRQAFHATPHQYRLEHRQPAD